VAADDRVIGPTTAITRSGLAIPVVVIDDPDRPVVAAREHPALVRLTHWLNAVSLVILTMSGLEIFAAFPSFGAKIPQVDLGHVPMSLRLGGWLGGALQWHFTFAWMFSLTGLVYVAYLALSGHWRHVVLRPRDVAGVWPMVRHYFLFGPKPVPVEPYNPLQKLAYTTTLGFGLLAVLSGLALARPVQFGGGPSPDWGFAALRMIHFGAMLGFAAFIPGHLFMVSWHGWSNFASMWTGWKKDPDYLN
jgi:thiosulfate reductase cytochrome b subunit